jgi:hypothetical protein
MSPLVPRQPSPIAHDAWNVRSSRSSPAAVTARAVAGTVRVGIVEGEHHCRRRTCCGDELGSEPGRRDEFLGLQQTQSPMGRLRDGYRTPSSTVSAAAAYGSTGGIHPPGQPLSVQQFKQRHRDPAGGAQCLAAFAERKRLR